MSETKYHLDLSEFSLEKLKQHLKGTRLLPSQQLLKEHLEERFSCLHQYGIENLAQLQSALKSKADIAAFVEATELPKDYLTLLRREVNSYQPKPINLKDFPGVKPDVISKLESDGIRNTQQLFALVLTKKDREELSRKHQIDYEEIIELTKLTDVSRLKWVGPKFARLLVESEYNTIEKVASGDYQDVYQNLISTNEEKEIYKGKFGIEDMKSWVTAVVQNVPRVIQY